ncbi:sodium/proton antiporter, CPA1 family [Fulvimarina manganoxydans]|uniref:Sodium/proton antiporter, CPA1 family n=1 Tax=Fulvimarina manganoxydans TaxID=937218 RepID=A0A1W2AEH2_9HYPH|nr:cation:proton antiporter [Fulvimarina manganoxydans]SMC59024.1 sodium/proton antiporter, CPA1 family [Fulvimarina manganoxydans]
MSIITAVVLVASLVALGALARPLGRWLRLPASIVLAAGGIALGVVSLHSLNHPGAILPAELSEQLLGLSVGSSLFLYVFLPTLIFQGALGVDMHRVREDLLPILIMALVAVVVATFGIGLALWPLAGVPLLACLLLGALVATTDPVAVIAIFREVGAPERLTRLVEGESLFNDAAAISLFLIFTAAIVAPHTLSVGGVLASLLLLPLGGAMVGAGVAMIFLLLARLLIDDRVSVVSLSLAVPFISFFLAEDVLGVSGVIAVVFAGVTLATLTPGRIAERTWRHLTDTWEQLASFAAILIFVLTSLRVPELVEGADATDLLLLAVVFVAALLSRALIIFGLFPLLARLRLSEGISKTYGTVMLWGGLRGSMTLALALAITENPAIPRPIAAFVATLATGFTLLTLFVQGTTLRLLIQRLHLNVLSGIDRAVRDLALKATVEKVEDLARALALRFRSEQARADAAYIGFDEPVEQGGSVSTRDLTPEEKLTLALVTLTARQREVVLSQFAEGRMSPGIARQLASEARRRLDAVRLAGEEGYRKANGAEIGFDRLDRLSLALQRRTGISRPMSRRLADRFERLVALSLVIDRLTLYARAELRPLLGAEPVEAAIAILSERQSLLEREISALRLQYPQYVEKLEGWIVARAAHAFQAGEIDRLHQAGVISEEVARSLLGELDGDGAVSASSPPLDLELDTMRLIERCDLFSDLSEADRKDLARFLRAYFVAPGEPVIRIGERGDAAFFIASGAMEVETGNARFRLGSGDVFGEMALVFNLPRQADVNAIAYSSLLRLSAQDFERFLARHPQLRSSIEAIARRRLALNESNAAEPVVAE